jgi:hypothetical protein
MDGDLFRHAGIELVLSAEPAAWKGHYMIFSVQWFMTLPVGTIFNGEIMRLNALRNGLSEPHHPNVWGAMANLFLAPLLEDGSIQRYGVAKAISARAHARRYPSYRKVVHRGP